MMMRRWVAATLLVMWVGGCATRGEQFPSDMSWIKVNETKKSDVKTLLGEPYSVGYASGKPTWVYGFYHYKLFGDSHTKELKFYWNRNGTVANFSFTSSFPEDVRSGVLQPKGQVPDEE